MTTKQLKLQECISSPFSGQYSQHVCAFNVPNTAAQNTLNTFHLTRGLLKVVEGKHTSLTCVVAQNQNTRTKTTEGLGFNCLVVCCYCFICNLKPTPLLQLLCSLQVPISTLHAPAPKVPQIQTANRSSLQGFCLTTIPTSLLLKFNFKIYGDAKGLRLLEIFLFIVIHFKKSKYCRNL